MNKPILDFLFLDSERVNRFIDLSNLAGKTITISGATGLLGMNLILTMIYYNNHTLEKKIRINALSLNTPPNFFAEIFKIPEVSLICGDITDEKFINKIPKSEFIIHCAGYGQPLRFIEDKLVINVGCDVWNYHPVTQQEITIYADKCIKNKGGGMIQEQKVAT